MVIRNIFLIFLVSGFWHGANWTFIAWGGLHALLFIPVFLTKNNRKYVNTTIGQTRILLTFKEIIQIGVTFFTVSITWIFFRAESLSLALEYIKGIFFELSFETYSHPFGYRMIDYFILLLIFVVYEFWIRMDERNPFPFKSRPVRFVAYFLVVFGLMLFFDSGIDRSFIYFQF